MQQTIVRVICAIGQSGQMGLKGHLPWEGDRSPEYKADVARFFEITRGQVLAAGPKTISSVPEFARSDRDLFVLRSSMGPEELFKRFAGRIVFIGGVVIPPHPQQEMPLRRLFMCLSPSSWR
jgi:dihydromethanopterin reductase